MSLTRLNKYLSENGYCSRREADRLIEAGRVFINGKRAGLGDKVSEQDNVRVEGRDKRRPPEKIYLLLNKPIGVVNVVEFVGYPDHLFPVGNLDINMEGLLLLTNDPVLSNRLMHPKYANEKEYVVEVDRRLDNKDIRAWQNGLELKDGKTLPAKVRKLDDVRFAIILSEERPQQIKRMCEALDYRVVLIKRTRILSLKMPGNYPVGSARHLTDSELRELKKSVGLEPKR